MGPVFKPDIKQAEYCGEHIQPMGCEKFLHNDDRSNRSKNSPLLGEREGERFRISG
jgi:hypothetical protein